MSFDRRAKFGGPQGGARGTSPYMSSPQLGLITNFKQHQKFCEVIRQFPMLRDLELRTHNTGKDQEWERDQGRDPDKQFAMKTNTYLNPPGVESRLFKLAVR